MAGAAAKKVVVEFPKPLLDRTERAVVDLSINRSDLIRQAVEKYLEMLQREKLEHELAEGYALNASRDRAIGKEFSSVDSDNF